MTTKTCTKCGEEKPATNKYFNRQSHKLKLRQQKHSNRLLQEDHNKYGPDAFRFEVVEEYPSDTPFETLEKIESEKIKCFLAEGRKLYNKPRGMRI